MDIVEKLRQDAWLSRATKDKAEHERAKLPSEAADEIERLRALVAFHEEQNKQADAMRYAALSLAFPNGFVRTQG